MTKDMQTEHELIPVNEKKHRRKEKSVPNRSARDIEVKGNVEERIEWRGQSKSKRLKGKKTTQSVQITRW